MRNLKDTHNDINGEQNKAQVLRPKIANERMEGVAISNSGERIAVALSDSGAVQIYRREAGHSYIYPAPQCVLLKGYCDLRYPHDLDFSPEPDDQLLAVADRFSMIQIFAKRADDGGYGPEPVSAINSIDSGLEYTDGVAFLPPRGDILAACNLTSSQITFYRRRGPDGEFESTPCFILQGEGVGKPDGLAFSHDGRWLALANHGDNTVGIFGRRSIESGAPDFGSQPVEIVHDTSIRYPHSVAFTPRYHHLLATNAGANYVSVFASQMSSSGQPRWGTRPAQRFLVGDEKDFAEINSCNKMEGGPKGIAINEDTIAICRPETGLTIYTYSESPDGITLNRAAT